LQGPVIPVISRRLSMAADLWLLCSFQGPWRGFTPVGLRVCRSRHSGRVPAMTSGRRSLKTQQHAGVVLRLGRLSSPSSKGRSRRLPSSQVRSTC
jgi:hypothetical protein